MTIDLFLLALVLVFALLGALTGAAKQVANVASVVLAWVAAKPLGTLVGPWLAQQLKTPSSVGIIVATVVGFIGVVVVARLLITLILRRLLDGKDPESRTVDRTLGFVLGGAKVAVIAWVIVCALSFVEDNVTIAGKRLGISPKDSHAFVFAKNFNLFELTHFSGVKDLAEVAAAATDPKKAPQLRKDPAYQRLVKDPRFKKLLDQQRTRAAMEAGDLRALLKDNAVLQLVSDPKFSEQLELAAAGLE